MCFVEFLRKGVCFLYLFCFVSNTKKEETGTLFLLLSVDSTIFVKGLKIVFHKMKKVVYLLKHLCVINNIK